MAAPQPSSEPVGGVVVPGVAGAGSGTLLVMIINTFIPEQSKWKQLLLCLAPSCSVGIAAVTHWCRTGIRRRQLQQEKERAKVDAQEAVLKAAADESIPMDERTGYQRKLAELRNAEIEEKVQTYKALLKMNQEEGKV